MKSAFGIFASLLLFCACKQPEKEYRAESYFDVPAFFDSEAMRLKSSQIELVKSTSVSDKSDSIRMHQPDWNREFKLFRKVNLNVPALLGKYQVTKEFSDSLSTTCYVLPEEMSGAVEVRISENAMGNIQRLECRIVETSTLTTHTENWTYVSDSGYAYAGSDRIHGVSSNSYFISGRFIVPK